MAAKKRSGEGSLRQKSGRYVKKAKRLSKTQESDSEVEADNSQDFQAISLLDSDDDLDNAVVDDGMSTDEGEDSDDSQASLDRAPKPRSSRKQRRSTGEGADDTPSDDDMDDASSADDSSDQGSARAGPKSKRNDPTTFSTSLQKILGTKLSTSRRSDPVLARSAAAREASRRIVDAALEEKAKRQMRMEKRVAMEKGRVKDVLIASNSTRAGLGATTTNEDVETTATILETERRLRKVAQRGVVKLFNAVRAAQVKAAEAERTAKKEGIIGIDKRDAKITEMSRKGFLDLIASGGGGLRKGGLEEA